MKQKIDICNKEWKIFVLLKVSSDTSKIINLEFLPVQLPPYVKF